jgi:hypothetical protein
MARHGQSRLFYPIDSLYFLFYFIFYYAFFSLIRAILRIVRKKIGRTEKSLLTNGRLNKKQLLTILIIGALIVLSFRCYTVIIELSPLATEGNNSLVYVVGALLALGSILIVIFRDKG